MLYVPHQLTIGLTTQVFLIPLTVIYPLRTRSHPTSCRCANLYSHGEILHEPPSLGCRIQVHSSAAQVHFRDLLPPASSVWFDKALGCSVLPTAWKRTGFTSLSLHHAYGLFHRCGLVSAHMGSAYATNTDIRTSNSRRTIAFPISALSACRPFSAFWDENDFRMIVNAKYNYECVNEGAALIANGIVSTATDFLVVMLPTLLCWKLQIPLRQKLALYSVFAISKWGCT